MNLVSKFQNCDRYRSKFLNFGFSDDFLKPIKNRKHLRLSLILKILNSYYGGYDLKSSTLSLKKALNYGQKKFNLVGHKKYSNFLSAKIDPCQKRPQREF